MNPRQRRGVLFLLLAGLGSLVVFFMVTGYVSDVNAKVAPMITVYRTSEGVPAYAQLAEANVEPMQIPSRYAPPQALQDPTQWQGQRIAFDAAAGTVLGSDMLLPASELSETEREVAIEVDAVTGIAGRVSSGDLVDIYTVFGDSEGGAGVSKVLVRNVRVVSVGGRITSSQQNASGALEETQVLPVTLALEPEDALAVTYADAFALSVRLVGLPPGIETQDRADESDSVSPGALGLPSAGGRP